MPVLHCLVVIQTNRLHSCSPLTLKLYIVDESAAVDGFLYKHENYVTSDGKTADADSDKLCTEVSTELKMWVILINCT